jgi:hypothetical protein
MGHPRLTVEWLLAEGRIVDPIRLYIPYAGDGQWWVVRRETTLISRAETFEAIERAAWEHGSALAQLHHTTLEISVQTAQGQWKVIKPAFATTAVPQAQSIRNEAD